MITNLHDFKRINEVRLPKGFFKVENTFLLPLGKEGAEDSASSVFNPGNIIEINTEEKYIKKWMPIVNPDGGKTSDWTSTTYPYKGLMDVTVYPEFKNNTSKLEPEQTPNFYKEKTQTVTSFVTTVKQLNKKINDLALEPTQKIKIIIL